MPTVTLTDAYDAKLKALVVDPFEESRESIIEGLIDKEIAQRGILVNGNGRNRIRRDDTIRLSPDSHGSLAHTKLTSATVDGRELHRPKWNGFMDHIHLLGIKRLGSFDALKKVAGARLRSGRHEQDGFKYIEAGDFSIQGVDANLCWDPALRLARVLKVPISVAFEWRDYTTCPVFHTMRSR